MSDHKSIKYLTDRIVCTVFTDYQFDRDFITYGNKDQHIKHFKFLVENFKNIENDLGILKIENICEGNGQEEETDGENKEENYQERSITYSMKRYSEVKSLSKLLTEIPKLCEDYLNKGYYHTDLAFRNIMQDENGQLQFIDMEALFKICDYRGKENYLAYDVDQCAERYRDDKIIMKRIEIFRIWLDKFKKMKDEQYKKNQLVKCKI